MHLSPLLSCGLLGASLAAAQSPSNGTNGTTTKPRTLIPKCFYGKIYKYTLFSAAALVSNLKKGVCAEPPFGSSVVTYISINSTDTQASIFRDDDAEEFIVAFPGTTSGTDFKTDYNASLIPWVSPGVDCTGCKAHAGFLGAYNSIVSNISSQLDTALKEYPCYDVVITGHSLGGALAAMAYPSLKGLKYPVKYAYTYGQPRVGDKALADYIDKLSGATDKKYGTFRRVTHSYDGVPNLPPTQAKFAHPRTEFFELDIYQGNGTTVPLALDNDDLFLTTTQAANATYRCYGQDSLDCNAGYAKGFINDAHLRYSGVNMVGSEGCGSPPPKSSSTASAVASSTARPS